MRKTFARTMVIAFLGGLFWIALFSSGSAQQLKIGWVDMARIEKEFKEFTEAEAAYEKEMEVLDERWIVKRDSMEQKIVDFQNELEKQRPMLTEKAIKQKEDQLRQMMQEYELSRNQMLDEAEQRKQEISKPLYDKIEAASRLIALRNNYGYILNSSFPLIVYAKDEYDITNQVLEELNK
jgi:outer membrane protein